MKENMKTNDKVNPVADSYATTPETLHRNSGSTDCSFSAIVDEPVVRYFEHATLCEVCDLLGLPHPKEYSHRISIEINVDSSTEEENKVCMTERYSNHIAVSSNGDLEVYSGIG